MPDKHQQTQVKRVLIKHGIACTHCDKRIENDDIDNLVISKIDSREPWRLVNLTLRHKECTMVIEQRRKLEEQETESERLEDLTNTIVHLFQIQAMCHNCGGIFDSETMWVDDLIILNKDGKQFWAHKVCPT